jgi:hypothetical protein
MPLTSPIWRSLNTTSIFSSTWPNALSALAPKT